jgi:predicted CoA-binding protein
MNHDSYSIDYIRDILRSVRTIALVGASNNDVRPSYFVLRYLLDKGYDATPINPTLAGQEILGR